MMVTFLLFSLLACSPTEEPTPAAAALPDLILVTMDTTRADRLGAYGDPLARTPNLDQLAKTSALFREAFTTVPLTLPAHASIMTGLYPKSHGIRDNASGRLSETVTTLAEVLQSSGYATGGFVGSYVLDGSRGLAQGFDEYHDQFNPQELARASKISDVERPAREVVQQALLWWEKQDKPRFLWVHLFDAHRPYVAPKGWTGDPYRGEVFSMDRALRPLFSSATESAGIVIVGDHGENLWDGGELEHGVVLTRSVLRVPLIVHPPGGLTGTSTVAAKPAQPRPDSWRPIPGIGPASLQLDAVPDAPVAARVIETPVSVIDIVPTLLTWAGQPCTQCEGRSLDSAIRGETLDVRPLYAESVYPARHYGWAPGFIATDGKTLLKETSSRTIYDPLADPYWERPLEIAADPQLGLLIDNQKRNWRAIGVSLDTETMAQLAALGYATENVPQPLGLRSDPSEKIDVLNRLFLAQGQMKSRPEEAKTALIRLIKDEPELLEAHYSLAMIHMDQQNGSAALSALDAVLKRVPQHTKAMQSKALVLRNLNRPEEARTLINALIAMHPHEARWHHLLVDLYGREKNFVGIRDACRTGLVQHPEDPFLHYMLGLALIQLEAPTQAIESLNWAVKHGTRAKDIALWQGRAYELLGNTNEAIEAFYRDAKNRPEDVRPVGAAGRLLAKQKKCGEALPFLLKAIERGMRDSDTLRAYRECGGQGF